MDTDRLLIDGLSAGREEAYKYLYEKYYNMLCLFAYQYVNDSYIAETIVGDVIFHIWQKRKELLTVQYLRSYLTKAVKNRCINYLEQQKRQQDIKSFYTENIQSSQKDYENQSEYPLANILEKELDVKIENVLNALPKLTREIFDLSRFSGLKYNEIAEKMGVSVDTVKYHIKSALNRLRADLKDYLFFLMLFCLFF